MHTFLCIDTTFLTTHTSCFVFQVSACREKEDPCWTGTGCQLLPVHSGGKALSHPGRLHPLLPCPQSPLGRPAVEDEGLWSQHSHHVRHTSSWPLDHWVIQIDWWAVQSVSWNTDPTDSLKNVLQEDQIDYSSRSGLQWRLCFKETNQSQ